MKRVLVTASREFTNRKLMARVFDERVPEKKVLLIHGACPRGGDVIAGVLSAARGWWTASCPADWSKGRVAGHRRNEKMIEYFKPDLVLAFPTESSVGTLNCIAHAEAAGIECVITSPENEEEETNGDPGTSIL